MQSAEKRGFGTGHTKDAATAILGGGGPETEWHRAWKDQFPESWQEVIHHADNGEKHIADVKTDGGWVLEFQHSIIKPEERNARNAFYPKLVWVVDGTKRKRDKPKFNRLLDEYAIRSEDPRFKTIIGPDDCKLLKDWHDSNALVFFDFRDLDDNGQPILWFLFPRIISHKGCLWPFSRDTFIELHNHNKFDALVENEITPFLKKLIKKNKMADEREEMRHREQELRMNWYNFGKRFRL